MGRFDIATNKSIADTQKPSGSGIEHLYSMSTEEEVNFLMGAHKKMVDGLAGNSLKEAESKFTAQLITMRKSKQISTEAYRSVCLIYKIKDPEIPDRVYRPSTGCSSITPTRSC